MKKEKRLYLSESNKKIAGVCGGLGEFFDIDPTIIRLAWIFIGMITAVVPAVFTYIIAWLIIPLEREVK